MPPVHRHVIVQGRVQNVYFRDGCRHEAASRGVAGWVRNRDDGSVEAVFEGEEAAVDAVIAWCRRGPPRARVDSVTVTSGKIEGLSGFSIR